LPDPIRQITVIIITFIFHAIIQNNPRKSAIKQKSEYNLKNPDQDRPNGQPKATRGVRQPESSNDVAEPNRTGGKSCSNGSRALVRFGNFEVAETGRRALGGFKLSIGMNAVWQGDVKRVSID